MENGMRIGIIGSGMVGQQLGFGLLKSGHEVKIGTRNPEKLNEWRQKAGEKASVGSFEDAAKFGEMIFIATKWQDGATENAIKMADKKNFSGKVVVDVTNPLLFEAEGKAPKLALGYPHSAGAMIQGWIPQARMVKAFNIINAYTMANPRLKEGTADLVIAGNDPAAKQIVKDIAAKWGWGEILDLGGIEESYMLEALTMIWISYAFQHNKWNHAFRLLKE